MVLESTQPLTEMVGNGGRGVGMKIMPPSCGDCHEILGVPKSWRLKCLLQGLLYRHRHYVILEIDGVLIERTSLSLSPSFSVTYKHIHLFLNNQPDALIIPILFCYKTLHVSGIFSIPHQEFSTVHSALVSFMQVFMTASKQSQDGTDSARKRSSKPA
jgi:hypothetical protein